MKLSSKIIQVILVVAILISSFAVPVFAEEAVTGEVTAADLTASSDAEIAADETDDKALSNVAAGYQNYAIYKEAVETLCALGILDEASYDGSAKVTRAAFTASAMKIVTDISFAPTDTQFTDVTSENPYSGAIDAAADMGIIAGYGNGIFAPDDLVEEAQAIKILVGILGYEVHANQYGGYPSGYLTVASRLKLTKDVIVDGTVPFTWDTAAKLIYNAIHTDVLQKSVGTTEEYKTIKNENPMTLWLGIEYTDGVVNANEYTSFISDLGCDEGCVEINGIKYYVGETAASNCFGYSVDAYYKTEGSNKKVLVSIRTNDVSKELNLSSEELISASSTVSSIAYSKDDSDRVRYADITGAAIIYNGRKLTTAPSISDIIPAEGSVKLISTTGGTNYDVVFVNEVQYFVVDTISKASKTIRHYYNSDSYAPLKLDTDDDADLQVKYTKYGTIASFDTIAQNNVLTVSKSKDNKLISIDIASDRVKGQIEEINEDGIVIDGEQYEVISTRVSDINALGAGGKATFILTGDGKIAGYINKSSSGEMYAYLIDAKPDVSGSLATSGKLFFRFYTINDEFVEYISTNKLKIDGSVPSDNDALLNTLKANAGGYVNQLVKIKVNTEGELTDIDLPKNNLTTAGGTGEYIDEFSHDYSFRTDGTTSSYIYYKYSTIGAKFNGASAQGMSIPGDASWTAYRNGETSMSDLEKEFSVFYPANSWYDDYKIYNIDVYDVTESRECGIVLSSATAASAPDMDLFLVDRIVSATDEDSMTVKKLYGLYQGTEQGYIIDEEANIFVQNPWLLNLRQGDVIMIALNQLNKITSIKKIFTVDPTKDPTYVDTYIEPSGLYNQASSRTQLPDVAIQRWNMRIAEGEEIQANDSYGVLNGGDTYIHAGEIRRWRHQAKKYQDIRNQYLLNSHWYNEFDHTPGQYNALMANVKSEWNVKARTLHARISDVNGDMLTIDLGVDYDTGYLMTKRMLKVNPKKSHFYVYDETTGKVRLGTIDDIDPTDDRQTAVIYHSYIEAINVVIVNHKDPVPASVKWVGAFDSSCTNTFVD